MTVNVLVNGERRAVSPDTSVAELVAAVTGRTDPSTLSGVAVAVDDRVVPRSQWEQPVHDGARVEVVTAVQGG